MAPGIGRGDDQAKGPVTAKDAFAKLKTLKGSYKNKVSDTEHHMRPTKQGHLSLDGCGQCPCRDRLPCLGP